MKGEVLKGKVLGVMTTADFAENSKYIVDGNKISCVDNLMVSFFEIKDIYRYFSEFLVDVLVLIEVSDDADVMVMNYNESGPNLFRTKEVILKEVLNFKKVSTWEFLIDNGVDKNYINDFAICYGILNGNVEIIDYFESSINMLPYCKGAIRQAASKGYLNVMKYFHIKYKANIQEDVKTLMYESVYKGHIETLKYLYEHQKNKISLEDLENFVCTAASNGHLEVIKYLHSLGVDISRCSCAVIKATHGNHLDIIEYLFDNGADIRVSSDNAFKTALQYGYTDIAAFLFDNGCEYDRYHWSNKISKDIPLWLYCKITNSKRQYL
jgi:hypothetical protein